MQSVTADALTEPQRAALGMALGKLLGTVELEAHPAIPRPRPAQPRTVTEAVRRAWLRAR